MSLVFTPLYKHPLNLGQICLSFLANIAELMSCDFQNLRYKICTFHLLSKCSLLGHSLPENQLPSARSLKHMEKPIGVLSLQSSIASHCGHTLFCLQPQLPTDCKHIRDANYQGMGKAKYGTKTDTVLSC